jgi:Amt family ammonium transporter
MDDDQLGEFAYDYVEVRRDYLAWTPAKGEPEYQEHQIPMGERHGIQQHSQMLEGREPSEDSGDNMGPVAQGDRHGMAYEKIKREKAGDGQ